MAPGSPLEWLYAPNSSRLCVRLALGGLWKAEKSRRRQRERMIELLVKTIQAQQKINFHGIDQFQVRISIEHFTVMYYDIPIGPKARIIAMIDDSHYPK